MTKKRTSPKQKMSTAHGSNQKEQVDKSKTNQFKVTWSETTQDHTLPNARKTRTFAMLRIKLIYQSGTLTPSNERWRFFKQGNRLIVFAYGRNSALRIHVLNPGSSAFEIDHRAWTIVNTSALEIDQKAFFRELTRRGVKQRTWTTPTTPPEPATIEPKEPPTHTSASTAKAKQASAVKVKAAKPAAAAKKSTPKMVVVTRSPRTTAH